MYSNKTKALLGFACLGLYALAGILQWHLESRLNALTGALLLLSAALLLWAPFGVVVHLVGAALLIGVVTWQRKVITR